MSAIVYEPDINGSLEMLALDADAKVLVVGSEDKVIVGAGEVRRADAPPAPLVHGSYRFNTDGGTRLMLVTEGVAPGPPLSLSAAEAESHDLSVALQWFGYLWEQGVPISGGPLCRPGGFARLRGSGELVTVLEVNRVGGHYSYLVWTGAGRSWVTEDGLESVVLETDDPTTWVERAPAAAKDFATALTVLKLSNPLTDTVYSYQSSKTVMRPYQFKPVLKLLNSTSQRILIADEVGLGKTIEAGLIWSELEARHQGLDRTLVVCPAVLVKKWQSEMERRFDRRLRELDNDGIDDLIAGLKRGDESAKITGVISLERLRSARRLAELNELQPQFDLIIVDEAHYLRNRGSRSHDLGVLLTAWADTLVFLSATPLNLGTDDLFNLLNLLAADQFDNPVVFPAQVEPNRFVNRAAARLQNADTDLAEVWAEMQGVEECELGSTVTNRPEWDRVRKLCVGGATDWRERAELKRLLQELNTLSGVLTRTRKVDVPDAKAVRAPHSVAVEWTEPEAALYLGLRKWAEGRARRDGGVLGFATQMPLRQAASCLPAAIKKVAEKDPDALELALRGVDDDLDDIWDEREEQNDSGGEGFGSSAESLAELAAAAKGIDTKFDRFAEFLEEQLGGEQQVLLFSYFRGTLSYLDDRLSELGYSCRQLHGGISDMSERQQIMNDFRKGEFQILLASEVGSEGLDFEFCNVLVNYDLPWNPMRVEQRIGRLDRFGQTRDRIHILNFTVPGTIETDIFERLYLRLRVFEESIGELEPVLREDFTEITKVALDPDLTDEERQRRVDQIELALEERRHQLGDIQEARSYLSGIDQLLIDGFEEDTTSRGRFVGPEELENLVKSFFAAIGGGRLRPVKGSPDRRMLIGGVKVGDLVAKLGARSSGSRYSAVELAARLRDEDPIQVTFSNEDASRTGTELLSLRHPVVRAAVEHLKGLVDERARFTSLRVPNLPNPSHRYLTLLCLAETDGLRPSLELWPVTLDLTAGEFDEDAGFALMASMARLGASDGPSVEGDALLGAVDALRSQVAAEQRKLEHERRRDNEALVDARMATRRSGIEHRIRRAEATLESVTRDGRAASVQRLHQGTIRNGQRELEELTDKMDEMRGLTLHVREIALIAMTGRSNGK